MVNEPAKALREALEMVRDADDDCIADGLPMIPSLARAKIDDALNECRITPSEVYRDD